MRGKILQYNGNEGTGIFVAEGQQHRFTLANWKGDHAPAVGKTVEVVVSDGQVQTVMLVADDVLMREKASEFTDKLKGLGSSIAAQGGGGNLGAGIVALYGPIILGAYGVFLIATLFFAAISIPLVGLIGGGGGPTLWALSGLSGGLKLLLLLSYLSVGVPFFWRDKRGWLALLVPALTMIFVVVKASGMGGLSSVSVLGFWLPAVAAAYLAFAGFRKFTAGA